MDGTALEMRSHQITQNKKKKQKQKKTKKKKEKVANCRLEPRRARVIIRIIRERLCPLGHGGVLTKSMNFITIVDVLHALIQNLCNLNQNAGL